MGYSFSVRAKSKDAAIEKVVEELDNVVNMHPEHAKDRSMAQAAAEAAINDLVTNDGDEVSCDVSGYLIWVNGPGGETNVTGVNLSLTANVVPAA